MAGHYRDRTQSGKSGPSEHELRAEARVTVLRSEHRGEPIEEETIGERGRQKSIDTTAGDEGIDEDLSTAGQPPEEQEQSEAEREGGDAFSGQGGQKGGKRAGAGEGTGYTKDRRGQLQRDDPERGTQGRHGRSGSRHGAREPQTGTSPAERTGGQTAQNPRIPRRDKR